MLLLSSNYPLLSLIKQVGIFANKINGNLLIFPLSKCIIIILYLPHYSNVLSQIPLLCSTYAGIWFCSLDAQTACASEVRNGKGPKKILTP